MNGWQNYVVWMIGVVVAVVVVRRLVCLFRGRGKGGCGSCTSTACPLRHPNFRSDVP